MSAKPKFDAAALEQALGTRAPADFSRAGRIKLLDEFFSALLEGREPSRVAVLFVCGGGKKWLQQGGSIERDYWRVSAPAGSHHTPAYLFREFAPSSRGAPENSDGAMIESPETTDEEGDSR